MNHLAVLLVLLVSGAPAVSATPPAPPPPGPCSLITSLNRIAWVTEDELRGHDQPVRWRNEASGAEILAASDEGGYVRQAIPDDWIDALAYGRITQVDGSQARSRRVWGQVACLSCATGTWGACSSHSVDMLPVQAAP